MNFFVKKKNAVVKGGHKHAMFSKSTTYLNIENEN